MKFITGYVPGAASATGSDADYHDGKTLLGADDKAGIAEIMTGWRYCNRKTFRMVIFASPLPG